MKKFNNRESMKKNIVTLIVQILVFLDISTIWYLMLSKGYYGGFDTMQKIILWYMTGMAILCIWLLQTAKTK